MRLFIGSFAKLDHYRDIKKSFSSLDASWVKEENLHLTYSFFPDEKDPCRLISALEQSPLRHKAVSIKGLGHFDYKILYAKVEDKILYDNHALLPHENLHPLFTPHITLARIKKCDKALLDTLITKYEGNSLGEVDAYIALIQSRLLPQGASYTILGEF